MVALGCNRGHHRAPVSAYVLQAVLEFRGNTVIVIDLAFTPKWLIDHRLRRGYEWVFGDEVSKPGGFSSVYSGMMLKEMVSLPDAEAQLEAIEKTLLVVEVEEEPEPKRRKGGRVALPLPMRPKAPPFPPPPPPPAASASPAVQVLVQGGGSSSSSGGGGGDGLSPNDLAVLGMHKVDDQARMALGVLAGVDKAAKDSLVFKLVAKTPGEIRNASAFVMQSTLNAMRSHNLAWGPTILA